MHSDEFYASRYAKYKAEVRRLGLKKPKYDLYQFSDIWDGLAASGDKRVFSSIMYSERYSTGYKTALAEVRAARLMGEELRLEDAKRMTTHDFADMFRKQMDSQYAYFKGVYGPKTAKIAISQYFFGSK